MHVVHSSGPGGGVAGSTGPAPHVTSLGAKSSVKITWLNVKIPMPMDSSRVFLGGRGKW